MRLTTRRLQHDESGFSMVEMLVAMTILAILGGAVLAVLTKSMTVTAADRNRTAATSLASREIEIIRNTFHADDDLDTPLTPMAIANAGDVTNPNPLAGGTAGSPLVVDGTPYTVQRAVSWMPLGSGASACDGGSPVSYPALAVHVSVTWPKMNGAKPVRTDTVLAPPKGVFNSTAGYLAVKVSDSRSLAKEGVAVTINGPGGAQSDQTGPDGCAVFVVATAGNYTANLNQSGWVDRTSNQSSTSASMPVAAGQLKILTMSYDVAETLRVNVTAPTGYALPLTMPGAKLANSDIAGSSRAWPASALSALKLWPYTDGYTPWAGTCSTADPTVQVPSLARQGASVLDPGASGVVDLPLTPVTISALVSGAPADIAFTATSTTPATCSGGDSVLSLGTTTAGQLLTSLPMGAWVVSGTGYANQTVTVKPGLATVAFSR